MGGGGVTAGLEFLYDPSKHADDEEEDKEEESKNTDEDMFPDNGDLLITSLLSLDRTYILYRHAWLA